MNRQQTTNDFTGYLMVLRDKNDQRVACVAYTVCDAGHAHFAVSCCNPSDTFELAVGAQLAIDRLLGSYVLQGKKERYYARVDVTVHRAGGGTRQLNPEVSILAKLATDRNFKRWPKRVVLAAMHYLAELHEVFDGVLTYIVGQYAGLNSAKVNVSAKVPAANAWEITLQVIDTPGLRGSTGQPLTTNELRTLATVAFNKDGLQVVKGMVRSLSMEVPPAKRDRSSGVQ